MAGPTAGASSQGSPMRIALRESGMIDGQVTTCIFELNRTLNHSS